MSGAYLVGWLRGEPGQSLKINLNGKAGVWADFATGERGNNFLELWRATRGTDFGTTTREAAHWLGRDGARAVFNFFTSIEK